MRLKFTIVTFIGFLCIVSPALSQSSFKISGTVYDTSKVYAIPEVKVFSTSGTEAETDSLGRYQIMVSPGDSIYFFYNGKNSIKYPVQNIGDYDAFDIQMYVVAKTKYKTLQPVVVFSDTYRMDSLENRERYAKIFGSSKPTITTSTGPMGVPGIDIGSIIELFQFRKNKQRQAFQQRLIQQEQDGYIDYRFNSKLVTRITGLTGKNLTDYMVVYRPSYEFVKESNLVEFYEYIIYTSQEFRLRFGIK